MTEDDFREFLRQNSHNWPVAKIEEMIVESSPAHFQEVANKKGGSITEEQAAAMASEVRKQVATSIAMYRTGAASEEDVLNHRIEKLPEDFPS
jgi:hypothetical protein